MAMDQIFSDIRDERVAQDQQWGGPSVDDTRTLLEWAQYIFKQTARAMKEWNVGDPAVARACMVKVAALAVAAIESMDRRWIGGAQDGDGASGD
jgi:hypothetical protein